MSRRRSLADLAGSGLGLLAIYASVRAAWRAGSTEGSTPRHVLQHQAHGTDGSQEHVLGTAQERAAAHTKNASARETGGRTYRELYEEAQRRGLEGRSGMSKAQLQAALSRSKGPGKTKQRP